MQLVKVDPIGVEPLQARLHSARDVRARRAFELALIIYRQAEFGREHGLFALWSKNSPELLLRAAPVAVAVGGVDQVDAKIDRLMHDPAGRREIDAAAEVVATEPDDGNFERGRAEPALEESHLAHCARLSPRIARASSGLAISRPSPRAMLTMRSTSI